MIRLIDHFNECKSHSFEGAIFKNRWKYDDIYKRISCCMPYRLNESKKKKKITT